MRIVNKSNAHLDGHSERLRDRFVRAGTDGLADQSQSSSIGQYLFD
jgi:hypothetical protein